MTSSYEYVLYEKKGKILRITLNDPARLNCLSLGMIRDIDEALKEAGQDKGISVIILRGAGRAFSAGYDLGQERRAKSLEGTIADKFEGAMAHFQQMSNIFDTPVPVIAQVHGYAMAGGSIIASNCDLCIIAEDAIVGPPQGGPMGIHGLVEPLWLSLMGPRKMKEMAYVIGSRLTGKEAERVGWANKAVPKEKLEEETDALARRIAKTPRDQLRLSKFAANRAMDMAGYRQSLLFGYTVSVVSSSNPSVKGWIGEVAEKGWKEARDAWHKRAEAEVDK